jgi:hypothetical protein
MNNKFSEEFLMGIEIAEKNLSKNGFNKPTIDRLKDSFFVKFLNRTGSLEFFFGASDFQIEILITKNNKKYAFKDLMNISTINEWITENRYIQKKERNLKDEVIWFTKLINFSYPILA